MVIGPNHVQIVEEPVTGWEVSTDGTLSVALDLTIGADLRLEGLAREFVRSVKDLRKRRGLRVDDRIEVRLAIFDDPGGGISAVFDAHRAAVARELLADSSIEPVGSLDGSAVQLRLGDGSVVVEVVERAAK